MAINKHLIIGALPPPLGGTTVLFKQLIDELYDTTDLKMLVIDTSVKSNAVVGKIKSLLRVTSKVVGNIKSASSISFHGSVNGALFFFPILRIICSIYKKPVIFRAFGGDFDEIHFSSGIFKKFLMNKFLLTADVLLFETKKSVEYFKAISKSKIIWYTNSRPCSAIQVKTNKKIDETGLKVVFIGHVKPSKGVRELVEAVNDIPDKVTLDIYGPVQEGIKEPELNTTGSKYRGILQPDEVLDTLAKYDLLAIPTYYRGEGYPGVILESYVLGIPVLATRWRCIPEIVDESCGLLVAPKSVESIKQALASLADDMEYYNKICSGARLQGKKYSSIKWTIIYYDLIKSMDTKDGALTSSLDTDR